MLAGLQSEVESMFPRIRGLTPDAETLTSGEQKLQFGRLVRLSGYRSEIFDQHAAKDRKAYSARMLDLSRRAQLGTVRILVNDRQILTRKDGSTGWFVLLEWMEYEWTEEGKKLTGKKKEE